MNIEMSTLSSSQKNLEQKSFLIDIQSGMCGKPPLLPFKHVNIISRKRAAQNIFLPTSSSLPELQPAKFSKAL